MVIKEEISVLIGATKVITYDATADFTTEAIEWSDFRGFALNVWFPVLNGVGAKPKITFQVSNSSDVLSFTDYNNYIDFRLPASFKKDNIEYKYIRFVYDSTGVNALSTITFNLNKNTI